MRLNIDVTMDYQLTGHDTVLLTLEAAQTDGQVVIESALDVEGADLRGIEVEGMPGRRVWAHVTSDRMKLRYRALVEVTRAGAALERLAGTPMRDLPGEVVSYLRPSRFCQSDLLTEFAAQQFRGLDGGARIAGIVDWARSEITYVPGSSSATTSAVDSFVARRGVCRDYAHLVCSLARAGNIPARYTSVYGADVDPPDFHAVAEVWLEGAWHLVDATGMSHAGDMVVIGSGRDASDVAFMETEDWARPLWQKVDVRRE